MPKELRIFLINSVSVSEMEAFYGLKSLPKELRIFMINNGGKLNYIYKHLDLKIEGLQR